MSSLSSSSSSAYFGGQIQIITGSEKEISAHVNGLQRLIAVRGGYNGLPPYVTEAVLSSVTPEEDDIQHLTEIYCKEPRTCAQL